jgi:hypothetical protein
VEPLEHTAQVLRIDGRPAVGYMHPAELLHCDGS